MVRGVRVRGHVFEGRVLGEHPRSDLLPPHKGLVLVVLAAARAKRTLQCDRELHQRLWPAGVKWQVRVDNEAHPIGRDKCTRVSAHAARRLIATQKITSVHNGHKSAVTDSAKSSAPSSSTRPHTDTRGQTWVNLLSQCHSQSFSGASATSEGLLICSGVGDAEMVGACDSAESTESSDEGGSGEDAAAPSSLSPAAIGDGPRCGVCGGGEQPSSSTCVAAPVDAVATPGALTLLG